MDRRTPVRSGRNAPISPSRASTVRPDVRTYAESDRSWGAFETVERYARAGRGQRGKPLGSYRKQRMHRKARGGQWWCGTNRRAKVAGGGIVARMRRGRFGRDLGMMMLMRGCLRRVGVSRRGGRARVMVSAAVTEQSTHCHRSTDGKQQGDEEQQVDAEFHGRQEYHGCPPTLIPRGACGGCHPTAEGASTRGATVVSRGRHPRVSRFSRWWATRWSAPADACPSPAGPSWTASSASSCPSAAALGSVHVSLLRK